MKAALAGAVIGVGFTGLVAPPLYAGEVPGRTPVFPLEMRLEPLPARAPEPRDNPSTEAKISLGRLLFFDPVLSAAGDVSCATCHHPRLGWADGRAAPIGVGGAGLGPERRFRGAVSLPSIARHAPTLLNVGFNGLVAGGKVDPSTAPMFADSRVQGLEAQILVPIRSHAEMRGDVCTEAEAVAQAVARVRAITEYRDRFGKAFDQPADEAVTAARLVQALAAFERTLVTPRAPIDRYLAGDASALSEEQQRGLRIFQGAGCIQCHGGPMFSDFKLHVIATPDSGVEARREFRTPTLRNLRHTAPYMHNGSLRTLRDVSIFYEALSDAVTETLDGGDTETQPRLDPLLKHLNLGPDDFPALEAFLETLNDDNYDRTVPATVPSGLPVTP